VNSSSSILVAGISILFHFSQGEFKVSLWSSSFTVVAWSYLLPISDIYITASITGGGSS
jgi:hypothetical protein